MIELVYALIRQLVELLPTLPQHDLGIDLREFEALNGTGRTIKNAQDLLAQILEAVMARLPCLFIVIDDMRWLDDRSTDKLLKRLIGVLRSQCGNGRTKLRILLTTTGRSRTLMGALEVREYVMADEGGRRGRGDTLVL